MKKNIYIYQNHFEVHLKLTQYCKSMILQLKKTNKKHCSFFHCALGHYSMFPFCMYSKMSVLVVSNLPPLTVF